MSNLNIYFPDSDDHLRRWFKETYQGSASGIIIDYVKRLYDTNGTVADNVEDPAARTREKLRSVFSDVNDSGTESAWLAEMRTARLSGSDIIHRRLSEFRTKNPELARYAEDEFRKLFPTLARAGGLA